MLRVKVCGITRQSDANLACELGADAIGLIFYPKSPRNIEVEQAAAISKSLPVHVARIGVFVSPDLEQLRSHIDAVGLDAVQIHGDHDFDALQYIGARRVILAIQAGAKMTLEDLAPYHHRSAALLLDAHKSGQYGGTGAISNWDLAREAVSDQRIILAGGLGPDNARKAVEYVNPYAIDVNSGVEESPGLKDREKLIQLFNNIEEYRNGWTADADKRFPLA